MSKIKRELYECMQGLLFSVVKISSSACGAICFKLFQYVGGGGLAPDVEDVYSLFCGAGHILTMFIHSNRVELLYCFI